MPQTEEWQMNWRKPVANNSLYAMAHTRGDDIFTFVRAYCWGTIRAAHLAVSVLNHHSV